MQSILLLNATDKGDLLWKGIKSDKRSRYNEDRQRVKKVPKSSDLLAVLHD